MRRVAKARYRSWIWKKTPRRIIMLSLILLLLCIGFLLATYEREALMVAEQQREAQTQVQLDYEENSDSIYEYTVGDVDVEELAIEVEESAPPLEQPYIESSESAEDDLVTLSNSEALSYLALVNGNSRLSSDFSPTDLSIVNVRNSAGGINQSMTMRETAARALERMFSVAFEEGGHLIILIDGYRSYETQITVHNNAIITYGEVEARRYSARPGYSEHQLGLAADLTTFAFGGQLSSQFSSTPEGMWVRDNAHRFGFIIRYPRDREADTGFAYEPWHLRYVGVDAATYIFENDLILEEFLDGEFYLYE